tara:strand:- start:26 stop:427 length:402 start_codon:yes stop_codon:yes gene_type:complete
MKKIIVLVLFPIFVFSQNNKGEDRFVYELRFEISQNSSLADAQKQFFTFADGFKQSEYATNVIVLQHHTGERMDFKILAFSDSWDNLNKMQIDAETYFASQNPTMFNEPWKIVHTGDSIYAVRKSLEEGWISR